MTSFIDKNAWTGTVSAGDIQIFEKTVSFDEDHHSGKQDTLIIKHEQVIPDWWVSDLKKQKIDTLHEPMGDFYRVASIPEGLYDMWLKQGYDPLREPVQKTLAKLKAADFDAFVTTNKRF